MTPFILLIHIILCFISISCLGYGVPATIMCENITFISQYLAINYLVSIYDEIKDSNVFIYFNNLEGMFDFMKHSLATILIKIADGWSCVLITLIGASVSFNASVIMGLVANFINITLVFSGGFN